MVAVAASCTAAHLYIDSQHLHQTYSARLEAVTAERDALLLQAAHTPLDDRECRQRPPETAPSNHEPLLQPIMLVAIWGATAWLITLVTLYRASADRIHVVDGCPVAYPVGTNTAESSVSPSWLESEDQIRDHREEDLDGVSKCDSSCSNALGGSESVSSFDPPSAAIIKAID